jgi:hypothetical protein
MIARWESLHPGGESLLGLRRFRILWVLARRRYVLLSVDSRQHNSTQRRDDIATVYNPDVLGPALGEWEAGINPNPLFEKSEAAQLLAVNHRSDPAGAPLMVLET